MKNEANYFLQFRGMIFISLSASLYGLLGFFGAQLLAHHVSVENMLFWRFFIALIWIMIHFIFVSHQSFMILFSVPLSMMKPIIFSSLSYSACALFYFLASEKIGTGIAMVIFFAYPVFVMIFGWQTMLATYNKYLFLSLSLVIFGLILLKGNGEAGLNLIGLLLAMFSAIFYAFYVHTSKVSIDEFDPILATFFVCMICALVFFMMALYKHTFAFPQDFYEWKYSISFGILSTAIPIQLFLIGLKYTSSFKASILSVFEPVVTVLVGAFCLHESISRMQSVGIIILLLGALLIQFDNEDKKGAARC